MTINKRDVLMWTNDRKYFAKSEILLHKSIEFFIDNTYTKFRSSDPPIPGSKEIFKLKNSIIPKSINWNSLSIILR